jgi:hypothetical protein
MSTVRVLKENYIDADLLTGATYSSQQTVAPATNLYDKTRRTKVWRSNGYWEITSANKVIIFRETVGVNLTATISESNYTSTTTFIAAIKTALDAAGDSTYTVSQDATTLKIKIVSNGAGGGGIFQLMWTNVSSTAASTLGFSTASDDTGALTYTADLLKIHTSEWVRYDFGVASNPKAFIAIGLRESGIQISESAVIKLQGNSTDVWTAPEYEATLTWQEEAITKFGSTGLHTTGLRYWRLHIVDTANPDGYVELSGVYLGDMYEPTQGAVQFPLEVQYVDLSDVTYSEEGTSFADVRQQTEEFTLQWFGLTKTEKEQLEDFVLVYGRAYPFYVAIDPDAVFSSENARGSKLVRFSNNPTFRLEAGNIWSSTWDLREEV